MRRTLAGPGSSTGEYKPKLDPGTALPAAKDGAFRRVGQAAGPASSHTGKLISATSTAVKCLNCN